MNHSENKQEVTDFLLNSGKADKDYAPGYPTIDLYRIVKTNNVNVVKYLLEGKQDLSSSALGCLLWYTIYHEYHEITKLLIEHGADVNQRGIRNHFYDPRISLLSWAAYCKNKHAVRLLIKHGAKVNDFNLNGPGALYFAITAKRMKIVRILLEKNANIYTRDEHGNTMFHIAAETGVAEMIKLLSRFVPNVNIKNYHGQNALHYAIQSDYDFKHIVELMVKLGVSINGQDNYRETPLHYALSLRKNKMAMTLLKYDVDVNAMSKDKIFPLYLALATTEFSHDLVKNILYKGANINEQTIDGETVLHYACRDDDHERINFLLSYKADINILNKKGQTPLSVIKNKKSMAAQTLLRYIAHLKLNRCFIIQQNLELLEKDPDLRNGFLQYR